MSPYTIKRTDKTNDKDEIVYTYYELPDLLTVSNHLTQAKPLLEEVVSAFIILKEQAEQSYRKQVEISEHYQKQIDQKIQEASNLKRQIDESKSEKDKLVDETKKRLQEVIEKLNKQIKESNEEIASLEAIATKAIENLSATEIIDNRNEEIVKLNDMLNSQNHNNINQYTSLTSKSSKSTELNQVFDNARQKLNTSMKSVSNMHSNTTLISNEKMYKSTNHIKLKMNNTLSTFDGNSNSSNRVIS